MTRLIVMFGVMAFVLTACGGGAGSSSSSSGITIHGKVLNIDFNSCKESFETVGDEQLTFEDGSAKVIGTTSTTSEKTFEKSSGPFTACSHTAEYSIVVPKTDFYKIAIAGTDYAPPPMSYQDLSAKGFEWDIETGSGDASSQL